MTPHHLQIETKTRFFTRWVIWVCIVLHVLRGVATLFCLFPWIGDQGKQEHIQRWSQRLLRIFGIELLVTGANRLPNSPYLLVSNHISWLDIHVINAFTPIRFVAKSEVSGWPVFGWMAKQLRTVFIRRDNARHARQVVAQVAEVLKTESICIFPEGTSTQGDQVLSFKSNLFASATVAGVPVFPLSIQYCSRITVKRSMAPAFIGEMGLLESMSNVVQSRSLRAQLTVLPPMTGTPGLTLDRKDLALYCHGAIAGNLDGR